MSRLEWVYLNQHMEVSSNWGTPNDPQIDHFVVLKPMGFWGFPIFKKNNLLIHIVMLRPGDILCPNSPNLSLSHPLHPNSGVFQGLSFVLACLKFIDSIDDYFQKIEHFFFGHRSNRI